MTAKFSDDEEKNPNVKQLDNRVMRLKVAMKLFIEKSF